MAKNKNKQAPVEEVKETETETEDAGEGTETEATGDGETKKKGYETLVVGVSKARKPLRDGLEAMATKLGCKPSDIVWYAIDQAIKNPPKAAPAGSQTNVGSAAGFWTVPITDSKGRATSVKVVEVQSRGELEGRLFLRYKKGEAKERERAKNQAIRAAQQDAKMIGYKGDIEIEELATA